MIATFIYTECQTSGPFKSEPGFKIKDVKVWKSDGVKIFHDSIKPDNSTQIESLVMEAIGSLPHFEPPQMSPFITNSDFLKLEKQWIYFRLANGYRVFARMSTTGLTHGRRGNPFHMGIIFDDKSLVAMNSFWKKAAGQAQIFSPADLAAWSGWLDPRTSEDLESVALSAEKFPMPVLLPKLRPIDDRSYLTAHKSEIRTALAATEESIISRKLAGYGSQDSWHFLKQASIVTSFLPFQLSWAINLFSGWEVPRDKGGEGWSKAILNSKVPGRNIRSGTWASIALNVLEKHKFNELEPTLEAIARGLKFKSTEGPSALWHLPFSALIHSAGRPDFLLAKEIENCYLVATNYWPESTVELATDRFRNQILERVGLIPHLSEAQKTELFNKISSIPANK